MECCDSLFRCNRNGMVSVTSASCYQCTCTPSMYIQGLISRNWPRQYRLQLSSYLVHLVERFLLITIVLIVFSFLFTYIGPLGIFGSGRKQNTSKTNGKGRESCCPSHCTHQINETVSVVFKSRFHQIIYHGAIPFTAACL